MQMQQMAAMMQASAASVEEAEELVLASPEEMEALEEEVKELEAAAKKAAKEKGHFVGLMARYIEDEGFGFIACSECKDVWDKTDIFVSGRSFMGSGIDVGDMVTFQVEKDAKDLPRALNPKTLAELTKQRRQLNKFREAAKAAAKRSAEAAGLGGGGNLEALGWAQPPDAKRANLGLGRGGPGA